LVAPLEMLYCLVDVAEVKLHPAQVVQLHRDPALIGQPFTEPEALLIEDASLVVTPWQPRACCLQVKRRRFRRAIIRRPRAIARFPRQRGDVLVPAVAKRHSGQAGERIGLAAGVAGRRGGCKRLLAVLPRAHLVARSKCEQTRRIKDARVPDGNDRAS